MAQWKLILLTIWGVYLFRLSDDMLVWLSVWSELQIFLHNMVQLKPLPSLNPIISCLIVRLVLPFWYRITQVVLKKRLLNGLVVVVVVSFSIIMLFHLIMTNYSD